MSHEADQFVDKVRAECGPDVICQECDATIDTFATQCREGSLVEKCQGYLAIQEATRKVLNMQEMANG